MTKKKNVINGSMESIGVIVVADGGTDYVGCNGKPHIRRSRILAGYADSNLSYLRKTSVRLWCAVCTGQTGQGCILKGLKKPWVNPPLGGEGKALELARRASPHLVIYSQFPDC